MKHLTVCRKCSYITVLLLVQSGGKYHRLQIPNDGHFMAQNVLEVVKCVTNGYYRGKEKSDEFIEVEIIEDI